ncbi:MAG: amino acid ABC transporter permease [Oscillospiraceae bacterium]|nr:amino acid ABC transporter permease [Oscillospiraceae bacterium]
MTFLDVTLKLLNGMGTTLELFALTLAFSLPLGLLICFGEMSNFKPLNLVTKFVVWVVRGTPLMLQVLVVYYGPGLMFGLPLLPRFWAALVTFVINYACYFAEIYRGGLISIPIGQKEAGKVLGLSKSQIFFNITLVQLVKRILPPMGNEFITLVKDTALVRVISVYEIIWAGESFIKKGMIWPLFYTGVFYLVASAVLTYLLGKAEKRLAYFE